MSNESCGICGGDGRIANSFGLTDKCPTCRGTGRRGDAEPLMRDVTKTKPSHHKQANKVAAEKKQWPDTYEGGRLATEIRDCATFTPEVRTRLIREVIDHEENHAACTQTFLKKIRKLIRAA